MNGMRDDWYWACASGDGPAGDRFVIENGQAALWPRVRQEIDPDRRCAWMPVQRMNKGSQLEDILDMMFTVVPTYGIRQNRFVLEAAKIPVFATFLRNARSDLCNYIAGQAYSGDPVDPERYSDKHMRRLGDVVSNTLGIEPEWF